MVQEIPCLFRGWLLVAVFVSIVGLNAGAQTGTANAGSSPGVEAIRQVQTEAGTSDYAYEQARFLCNSIGPRLSGSQGADAAVGYVARQMRDLGLDVRLEPVTVRHWERGEEDAQLVQYAGQSRQLRQRIVVTALGNTPPTPSGGITAPVVLIDSFEQLATMPEEQIRGKIVVFNARFNEFLARAGEWNRAYFSAVRYRNEGPSLAGQKKAAAALVRSIGPAGFRLVHTGQTVFQSQDTPIPAGAISAEDADLIADLSARGEILMHLVLTPRDLPTVKSYNVIADIKGSEQPEQIVVVSGHLDSWDLGTGALDDAAGVAAAMDVIRLIKRINAHPKRTIRFIAWMNEENGGVGGQSYAQDHKSELSDHLAAIEIDTGDGRPLGWSLAATPKPQSQIANMLAAMGGTFSAVSPVSSAAGFDLTFMNAAGVPAISPVQEALHYFDYHHTPADTFDKIRKSELRELVREVAILTYALAEQQTFDFPATQHEGANHGQ